MIIERSGGSADKINLEDFMESINLSFIFVPATYWLGVWIEKNPLDMIILQEIIFEKRPDVIIECGTYKGGSAYYMAHLMDLMNINGKIITIDRDVYERPTHPKIEYIHADCLTAEIPKGGTKTMVILDCDHSANHVYAELEKFSKYVTPGQYLIVEDTVVSDKANGPAGAVQRFLSSNKNFRVDKSREKYGVTCNPGGYLLKK